MVTEGVGLAFSIPVHQDPEQAGTEDSDRSQRNEADRRRRRRPDRVLDGRRCGVLNKARLRAHSGVLRDRSVDRAHRVPEHECFRAGDRAARHLPLRPSVAVATPRSRFSGRQRGSSRRTGRAPCGRCRAAKRNGCSDATHRSC